MEKNNGQGEGGGEVHGKQSDPRPRPTGPGDQDKSRGTTCPGQTKDAEEDRDDSTCGHPSLSSSSSSSSCLSPPLPPSVELTSVLADTRLTLDVYKGGAAVLPQLWASIPQQMMGVQYLTLGSEDAEGHRFYDTRGDPLPGLLTTLPMSFSCLSQLVHLDLSFNQLSSLPACLLGLPALSSLLLCQNRISELPPDIGRVSSLAHLSLAGNRLVALPPGLGRLTGLHTLDVSLNLLRHLPDEIGSLSGLVRLELSQNKLRQLPESVGSLSSLRELFLYSNDIRVLPPCLSNVPLLKIDLRGNPLGRPPTPPPPPEPPEPEIPELHLGFNQRSFCVSPAGCRVFLPGGAELLFPPGCLSTTRRLEWEENQPEKKLVRLQEHEILLSCPLELRPHGITFLKPVEVCVPYHRPKKSEVVVQRFDGLSWSTLSTLLRRGRKRRGGGRRPRLACCTVCQFSWFMVVSRPVKDTCSLTSAGTLLVSSIDPGIKLRFPPDCTLDDRTVTLQVLQVSAAEVQVLCGDPQARVGPLLCLSQDPSTDFLQPVKVQVPLPPGVTGHTADTSRLRLLHGDPAAQTWTDVTSEVSLYVTEAYAVFYVTHFSWYWLWYTTLQMVCGSVRRVYQKLKLFKVQFLALQRRSDPSQVILQCLPSDKVDSRVQTLSELYDGPQPSDVCDLLEGEQFFAGFESGLDISTERPDCVEGRLRFVFYSSLKNLKEVYICAVQGHSSPVRGQVSFYRGEVPSDLPEELARKRKGLDKQWLATLPVKLPALDLENGSVVDDSQCPPLNLGDPESGFLTESNLLSFSVRIGRDWRVIGINLGLSYQELDRIQYKHRDNLGALVLDMLFRWARGQKAAGPGAVSRLVGAMIESGRRDLAEEIEDTVRIGRRKYSESLKRVGLEERGSFGESALAAAADGPTPGPDGGRPAP